MSSVLSSLFSRDPKSHFPYDLPSISFFSVNGISIGKSFKKAEPLESATCFWAPSSEYGAASDLKLQAQKLKTMRHPNVLAYFDSIEADNTFYLITEACTPLSVYINEAKWTASQKEFVISWGLFQLMSCLKFLHREAKLSHENVRRSVYVTEAGDWKLGGFERATAFTNPQVDLNSLALLVWELFNGFDDNKSKPEPPGCMPKRLHHMYKKMASGQAARLNIDELLDDCRRTGGFFKNRFVDTLLFLEEFQLKDVHDKQAFFSKLKDGLDIFPDDFAKYKILPQLIHTYEYGDAGSHVLTPLFKLGRLLDNDEYQQRIVPCVCKLFSSPDRVTRVKLLEKIDEFAPHLSAQVVNEKIYGNLAAGFLDTNPAVRESTVKAMVSLADKLNNHNLNTDLMKYLAKLQGGDDQPGIRTNTTICLGKIGCYIDPSQRQRILISAFTRALKDPFPPARVAAVLALSATQQYYSLVEVANRIVPSLAPLTCDPEKQVREQSFKALHGFIGKLEKASENPEMIPELEAQVQAGGKSGLLSSDKVPQWASWALKSLSGKFYKGTLPVATTNTSGTQDATNDSITVSRESTPVALDKASRDVKKSSGRSTVSDGWGDLEDEIGSEDENKEKEEKWEDVSNGNDDDDWSSDWQTPSKSPPKKFAAADQSATKPKSGHGGLKLQGSSKKALVDDNLDFLLGIVPESKAMTNSSCFSTNVAYLNTKTTRDASSNRSTNKDANEGWDDFSENLDSPSEQTTSGWDDVDWGTPTQPSRTAQSREARRSEIAARNEARRKELASRRAAKELGAVRLGATYKPS